MGQVSSASTPFMLVLAAWLVGMSIAPGCSGPSQRQMELDHQYTKETRFRVQLSSELLDVADTAAAMFETDVINARLAGRPEREIAYLEITRNGAVANYRSLALGQDAWGCLQAHCPPPRDGRRKAPLIWPCRTPQCRMG